ncbi:hypothetical protein K466DRAFT_604669, partial [Polyporus arcularius HHB13444]
GDILQQLKEAKVPRVPTLVCHGDIDDQETLTPDWWEEQNPTPTPNPYPTPFPSHFHAPSPAEVLAGPSSSASNKRKAPDDGHDTASVPPPEGVASSQPPFREDSPLRRHKHYRLVEEEVALPLNEFQSGKQLIKIVRDCVIAHYHATVDAKLVHRDISSGNLLIQPKILWVQDPDHPQKERLAIKFAGLLADWEMAKSTDPQQQGQRQPERTGTWRYMSVALLSHLKANVEVCDEVESFFYIVLYHAVRYLESNLNDNTVANYIDGFFDQYGFDNDQYTCGDKKLSTIMTGKLANASTKLVFAATGMNKILENLLSWFHANHIVTEYDRTLRECQSGSAATHSPLPPSSGCPRHSTPPPRPPTPPSPSPSSSVSFARGEFAFEADIKARKAPSARIRQTKHDWAPSAEQRELARLVVTHDAMLDYLDDALEWDAAEWEHSECVGDRVPLAWRLERKMSAAALTVTSSKRQKLSDTVQSEPLFL